jgi:putative addiction module component (TIGR02574 family)
MSEAELQQLLSLPVEDRIDLIDRLWESVGQSPDFELSEAQKAELDRRIADLEAHPHDGRPWEDVLKDLRKKL